MKYLIALLLVVVAVFALRHYMPSLGESAAGGIIERDGVSVLSDCPDTPNCQSSSGRQQSKATDIFPITLAPKEAIASMARVVESISGMTVEQYDERYLHATSTSKVMRFVDDVEFLVNQEGTGLYVRSASRLGKSDLGANAKRIALMRELSAGKL